jgi:hypothetical protein
VHLKLDFQPLRLLDVLIVVEWYLSGTLVWHADFCDTGYSVHFTIEGGLSSFLNPGDSYCSQTATLPERTKGVRLAIRSRGLQAIAEGFFGTDDA